MTESNNVNKLAKNTIALYVQMFISMLIALYTSRVLLNSLGVEDYGLYNVVGGVVAMITVITGGMSTSTQRFLSFELGKEDNSNLKNIFSMCVSTHILIAVIFFIIAESIGVWFLNKYIQIPEGREVAANFVYQFSVLSVCFNLCVIPFSASVLSHERMNVYAAIGIFDVVLKLVIALLISISPIDKLIFYGGLLMLIVLMNLLIYLVYCHSHFEETHYHFYWDKNVFESIFSFASWTIVGQGAMVGANQGTSILVNMFHTVRANAAMGVAAQVNSALTGLTSHFYIAYQPQITKAYSSQDYGYMNKLLLGASKLSFLLVFVVSIPILYNLDAILKIWLGVVPEDTSIFCFLFIVSSMINALGNPFLTGVYATGSIKNFQLISTALYLLDLVIIFVLFKIGFPAFWGPATKFIIDILLTTTRILYANKLLSFFSLRHYLVRVLFPLLLCIISVVGITFLSSRFGNGIAIQLLKTTIVFLFTLLMAYFIGLNKSERIMARSVFRSFTARFKSISSK